jgi:hypothetical protein
VVAPVVAQPEDDYGYHQPEQAAARRSQGKLVTAAYN